MDPKHLERLARDIDEQHREAMRSVHDDLHELHFGTSSGELADSRRRFLKRAASSTTAIAFGSATFTLPTLLGAGATAALAQGTGSTPGTARSQGTTQGTQGTPVENGPTTTAAPHSVLPEAELELVRFAESVERAAVVTYEAAVGTRLFDAPTSELFRLFGRQHLDHADAHLAIINADKLGKDTYGSDPAEANAVLMSELQRQLRAATDGGDRDAAAEAVLRVAYGLEEGAAATYLLALGVLETQKVAAAVASIMPVEAQHAVVLGQILELDERDYLPGFQTEAASLSPDQYALS